MAVIEIAKIQVRRGQENQTGMPQLDPGEFGWAEDTQNLYIGKRIAEGAVDDSNTRILTEVDLKSFNIFNILPDGSTLANTSTYKYQENVSEIASSISTIATKLDTWVSLTDFAEYKWDFTETIDITTSLQNALGQQPNPGGVIENDLANWAPRSVMIPAGYYIVTAPIDLPPNTKLIGDGKGRTVITASTNTIFQTVDSTGTNYIGMNTEGWKTSTTKANQPKNIHIEGMTLINSPEGDSVSIYLDNVNGATLLDIQFGDIELSDSTNVVGVMIRDTSAATIDTLDLAYSANIKIDRCNFNGLSKGVYQNTGTTNCFSISNSEFTWMTRGIEVWNSSTTVAGPVNGIIENNTFDLIYNEAVYVGYETTSTNTNSYVLSNNNIYRNVGNNCDITNDSVSSGQVSSVIKFNSLNNRSVNDQFDRFSSPLNLSLNLPVVSGHAYIENSISYGKLISASTTSTTAENILASFALNEYDQLVTINYTLNDVDNLITSRTGNLIMNIVGTNNNPEAFASVGDYYNFADLLNGASEFVQFSTDHTSTALANAVSLTCWNFLNQYYDPITKILDPHPTNLDFKYQFNILQ